MTKKYIWQQADWPNLQWDEQALTSPASEQIKIAVLKSCFSSG
ncbi:MAG: DUF4172 domain-containing protein [Candidatus Electrothrix sp. AS4_5]|nr:DUF4172 domain-containing protein [Candidatus Electrothrix gigas]